MNSMNFTHADMVRALAKPGADILASLTPEKAHMLHMVVGISGEAAEVLSADFQYHQILFTMTEEEKRRKDEIAENIKEELGDLEFYIEGLLQSLDTNYEDLPEVSVQIKDFSVVIGAGISISAGNVLDLVKKHVIYNKPIDKKALLVEVAGLAALINHMGEKHGFTREEILLANKVKLGVRYQNGYSDEAAQKRADKVEEAT